MAANGTDSLINHTFKGLVEGVSEQINEQRRETQLDAMENCIPHISRGVLRRNPVDVVSYLNGPGGVHITPSDYYVYSYDRGSETEQYLMLVGDRKWYTFNANTGVLAGWYGDVNNVANSLNYLNTQGKHPRDVFSLVTVGDYTWINNNTITTKMTTDVSPGGLDDYKKLAVYWVKKTQNVVTAQNPTTGVATILGLQYSATHGTNTATIVGGSAAGLINSSKLSAAQIASEINFGLNGGLVEEGTFYWTNNVKYSYFGGIILVGEYYCKLSIGDWGDKVFQIIWDGKIVYTYTGVDFTYNSSTIIGQVFPIGLLTQYKVGALKTNYYLDGEEGFNIYYYEVNRQEKKQTGTSTTSNGNWKVYKEFVYNKFCDPVKDFDWSDGDGSTASFGFKGTVRSISQLPANLPAVMGDVIVKIDSSENDVTGEEYWMKWNGEFWKEWKQPGSYDTIDKLTMPHTFIRNEAGSFVFGNYGQYVFNHDLNKLVKTNSSGWDDRLVGDTNTAPQPSFINKKISSIFFHNNRLGILAEDNIAMSELGIYSNFWPTTIRTIPDTDPIDITAATVDVTNFKTAHSVSGSLLIFSERAQFILSSTGGNLTPESAVINKVSNYDYNDLAPAKAVGNKLFFTTESGNGTQMFNFELNSMLSTGSENVAANNLSLHIPTYLPIGIKTIVGHSILGYIFMHSYLEPSTIYVLNTLTVDAQTAQNAFHKWTFDYDIVGINIIKNKLNIVFKNLSAKHIPDQMVTANTMTMANISLDIPSNMSLVNYTDNYDGTRINTYRSMIRLSKWQIKDSEGYGTMAGRLQIRTAQFATSALSKYKVSLVNDTVYDLGVGNWIMKEGKWNDAGTWSLIDIFPAETIAGNDEKIYWRDGVPYSAREYYNDTKVTVASNAANTYIVFESNTQDPSKGFELATVNLEGMFRQRSTRY